MMTRHSTKGDGSARSAEKDSAALGAIQAALQTLPARLQLPPPKLQAMPAKLLVSMQGLRARFRREKVINLRLMGGWQDRCWSVLLARLLAWSIATVLFVFLLNTYLTFWRGWPGALAALSEGGGSSVGNSFAGGDGAGGSALAALQLAFYIMAPLGAATYVWIMAPARGLRQDAASLSALCAYFIRAAFWAVLLVGLVDLVISWLRVENVLADVVGQQWALELGRSKFRAPYIHLPLIAIALIIAARTHALGFIWLTLLVVMAEFMIVLSRFIFSYEQAFMGDLVRFWYAALFLFGSAHTLLADGHVRVDVLYAGFSKRQRGIINAVGSILLGVVLCWVILLVGLWGRNNIIAAPLLSVEVSQSGFGLYLKYLMAGFLAVYASTMMLQFAATFLTGIADSRGETPQQGTNPLHPRWPKD